MALTNAQKADVRLALGFSLLYSQVNPELEGQMIAVANLQDGGATEALILTALTGVAKAKAKIDSLLDILEAGKVDELGVDPVRARVMACQDGRRWVKELEIIFNITRKRDVFSSGR